MGISLADYEERVRTAVRTFWETRGKARLKQKEREGVTDVGHRAAVTAGKNMDGFAKLTRAIVVENGLSKAEVFSGAELTTKQRHTTLPGYYRPVKDWDLLVVHGGELVAALEFKSQVGPSFGNNFNNRCEEALGMGEDLRVAFREGAIGDPPKPFLGYLMLLEDDDGSRSPVRIRSKHFPVLPEFEDSSYADRYELLCRRLVAEELYDAAALLLSPAEKGREGAYSEMSKATGLRRFVAGLAGRVATAASMDE